MPILQKVTPFLSFNRDAEDAAKFYTSVFRNSRITGVSRYDFDSPHTPPKGTVMTVSFELDGQQFTALNGGPSGFNQAVSFVVNCKDQAEIDYYWERLTADGGSPVMCGWLKDRFGLSWQIVPEDIFQLISGPKSAAVMEAVMGMIKLDADKLRAAAR
ncbi:MAG: VOC family protein [Phycisphaerales bacterium]